MKKELTGFERYKLQWMIDHGYSLKDLMNKIAVIINEELCVGGNAHGLIDEAFDMLENETGFVGSEIWACEDEWEDNEADEHISYNVGFISNDGNENEIQFDIPAISNQNEAVSELMTMFDDFCKKNQIQKKLITYIEAA